MMVNDGEEWLMMVNIWRFLTSQVGTQLIQVTDEHDLVLKPLQ